MLENGIDLFHFANVAGEGLSFTTGGDNLINHFLTALYATTGDNNVGALFGEQFGNGFTNASASAGYQRYSVR